MPVENTLSRIAEQTRDRYEDLISGAQKRASEAAGRVTAGKKPVQTLTRLGLQLTAVSHRTTEKMLKQNTKMVENQLDAFAGRLQAAAAAHDVREFVGTQMRLVSSDASRFVRDARDAVSIVAGAGSEITGVIKSSVNELRGRAPASRKTARKTTRKTTRKATRKTVKKPAAKPATKKTTTVKAQVRAA